jgi:tetratricopeptide (TPR) repeat protein
MFAACSQNGRYYRKAKKSYERGNAELAVSDAARSLRIKPDNKKAQDLLQTVWTQTLNNHNTRVSSLEKSSDPNAWEQILSEHIKLQGLAEQIQNLPPLIDSYTGYRITLEIPDLSNEIKLSRENAAEAHYQAGIRYDKMSKAIDTQRKAAREYQAALNLIPGYKDAQLKYEQARKLAIKRIAIAPFTDKSNTRNRYGAISELMSDLIVSRIMEGNYINEFTEIIARSQMDAVLAEQQLSASGLVNEASTVNLGQILGAHEIITGSILQVVSVPSRTSSVVRTAKATVVIGKEEYQDEEGKTQEREIKGEVSCDYKLYTKTASASITGSFSILDVETGRIIHHESLDSKNPWQDSWVRVVRGDQRALNSSLRKQLDKAEPYPPDESEMVSDALKRMSDTISSKLRSLLK